MAHPRPLPPPISLEHPALQTLIIGAGLGGLVLANLLQVAGLPYLVLEQANVFQPLGSAISLNHLTLPLLAQLGLYEDLKRLGLPFKNLTVHKLNTEKGEMETLGTFGPEFNVKEKLGYPTLMLARADLLEVLLKNLPKERIMMGKKVLNSIQNNQSVTVHTADGFSYQGELLVGADGCYSRVREAMFQQMTDKGVRLSRQDYRPMQYNFDTVVGVTHPLDSTLHPAMDKPMSEFQIIVPKSQSATVWLLPLRANRLGWMINERIIKPHQSQFRAVYGNKEPLTWRDGDAAQDMCKRFGTWQTPYGPLLEDFIQQSPFINKVRLEEKYYDTWQYGRTCLLGDACHKVLPFGGVGATYAMLDALQLANLIYSLRSNSFADVREMLQTYYNLRKDFGKEAVSTSAASSSLFHDKGWKVSMTRYAVLNILPDSLLLKNIFKGAYYTYQCNYLPFKKLGSVKHLQQAYGARYLLELEHGIKQKQQRESHEEEEQTSPEQQQQQRTTMPPRVDKAMSVASSGGDSQQEMKDGRKGKQRATSIHSSILANSDRSMVGWIAED